MLNGDFGSDRIGTRVRPGGQADARILLARAPSEAQRVGITRGVTDGDRGSSPVEQIERLWRTYRRGGVEGLRELVDDDVEWRPYGAGGEVLRGYEELADYLRDRPDLVEAETYAFEEHGDTVIVSGHLRLRSGVSLTDTQLYWVYSFREGRLVRFEAHTNRAAALAAIEAETAEPSA